MKCASCCYTKLGCTGERQVNWLRAESASTVFKVEQTNKLFSLLTCTVSIHSSSILFFCNVFLNLTSSFIMQPIQIKAHLSGATARCGQINKTFTSRFLFVPRCTSLKETGTMHQPSKCSEKVLLQK